MSKRAAIRTTKYEFKNIYQLYPYKDQDSPQGQYNLQLEHIPQTQFVHFYHQRAFAQ